MNLLISISIKRDVESNEYTSVSFYRSNRPLWRYKVCASSYFFFVPFYYIKREKAKKKGKKNYIVDHVRETQKRLTTLFIWKKKITIYRTWYNLCLFVLIKTISLWLGVLIITVTDMSLVHLICQLMCKDMKIFENYQFFSILVL
jgi:hypothetical protein